jgi:hypothetical protein
MALLGVDWWSDTTSEKILVLHAAATLVMVGLIWFVQIVHYPLLARFGRDTSTAVAEEHQRRTGYVVALPMAVEGLTTLALLVDAPAAVWVGWPWIGAVLLAVVLLSTAFVSVPLHARMAHAHDERTGRRLVLTNWPRTVGWTARGAISAVMVLQSVG